MGTTVKEQTGREFMFNEKFGFIHSCPTNLGTGKVFSINKYIGKRQCNDGKLLLNDRKT